MAFRSQWEGTITVSADRERRVTSSFPQKLITTSHLNLVLSSAQIVPLTSVVVCFIHFCLFQFQFIFSFFCSFSAHSEIVSFGYNRNGECGIGRKSESEWLSVIPKEWNGNIILFAVGEDHCIAVTGIRHTLHSISPSPSISLCLSLCLPLCLYVSLSFSFLSFYLSLYVCVSVYCSHSLSCFYVSLSLSLSHFLSLFFRCFYCPLLGW